MYPVSFPGHPESVACCHAAWSGQLSENFWAGMPASPMSYESVARESRKFPSCKSGIGKFPAKTVCHSGVAGSITERSVPSQTRSKLFADETESGEELNKGKELLLSIAIV